MADNRSALKFELQELLLVAMGAVPGALLRWQLAMNWADQNLMANTLGAGVLGFLAGLPAAPRWQLFLGIGFCGSLTTFSGWMLDVVRQLSVGDIKSASGLVGLTVGFGLGAVAFGYQLGRQIRR